jgi:hypothetical protein
MINVDALDFRMKDQVAAVVQPIPLVKGEKLLIHIESEDLFDLISSLVLFNVKSYVNDHLEKCTMEQPENYDDFELQKKKKKIRMKNKVLDGIKPKINEANNNKFNGFLHQKMNDEIWRNYGFILPKYNVNDE